MITIGQISQLEKLLAKEGYSIGIDYLSLAPTICCNRNPNKASKFSLVALLENHNTIEEAAQSLKGLYNK